MHDGKNHALERFMTAVGKDPAEKAPPMSMVGSFTLMQGEVPANALDLVPGRRKKAA